jgi:adenylylsulfate kinase-like enzyme
MKIKVTIDGPMESGKTTIARIISDALNKHGIANEVHDEGDEFKHFQNDRLALLAKRGDLLVDISTNGS